MDKFTRLKLIIDKQKYSKLTSSNILIFGLGGVGGYVVEGLVRSGIEKLTLVDFDKVSLSNFNRQIIADDNSVDKFKTEVFSKRIKAINSKCEVTLIEKFVLPKDISAMDFSPYHFVIDAIDTITTKIAIIQKAKNENIKVISAMGFGNKFNPSKIMIGDITTTSVCPLAKVMRKELKQLGIFDVPVVYSTEQPIKPNKKLTEKNKVIVGSFAPVVATAGMAMAAYVIEELIK